jgi:hypothetical protein
MLCTHLPLRWKLQSDALQAELLPAVTHMLYVPANQKHTRPIMTQLLSLNLPISGECYAISVICSDLNLYCCVSENVGFLKFCVLSWTCSEVCNASSTLKIYLKSYIVLRNIIS